MSTLDSGMNSLAAVATKDVYLRYIRPQATDHQQLWCSRLVTIWMSFSCVIAPMFLIGVTTARVNGKHLFYGVLLAWACTIIMIVWYILTKNTDPPISFMWVGTSGSVLMTIFCYLPTIFRRRKEPAEKINGLTLWTLKKTTDQ